MTNRTVIGLSPNICGRPTCCIVHQVAAFIGSAIKWRKYSLLKFHKMYYPPVDFSFKIFCDDNCLLGLSLVRKCTASVVTSGGRGSSAGCCIRSGTYAAAVVSNSIRYCYPLVLVTVGFTKASKYSSAALAVLLPEAKGVIPLLIRDAHSSAISNCFSSVT